MPALSFHGHPSVSAISSVVYIVSWNSSLFESEQGVHITEVIPLKYTWLMIKVVSCGNSAKTNMSVAIELLNVKGKGGKDKETLKGTELVKVCCKSIWGPKASAVPMQFEKVKGN